jgi:hypothetical protein
LILDDEELFGDEVNLACKLGEDIGDKGEILLTAAAQAGLADSSIVTRETTISISGLMLTFYALEG